MKFYQTSSLEPTCRDQAPEEVMYAAIGFLALVVVDSGTRSVL